MASSPFARLLEPVHTDADNVVAVTRPRNRGAARRRRWSNSLALDLT
jgi:hypothetical protein